MNVSIPTPRRTFGGGDRIAKNGNEAIVLWFQTHKRGYPFKRQPKPRVAHWNVYGRTKMELLRIVVLVGEQGLKQFAQLIYNQMLPYPFKEKASS